MTKVNIVQGKRDFSRLIQLSNESDGEIIVTRRGIPVAVLISYDHYQRLNRLEGYRRILQTRKRFTADEKLHRAVKAGSGTAIRLGDLKIHDDNKIEWPDNGAPDD